MMQLAFTGTSLEATKERKRTARQFTYETKIIGEDADLMEQGGKEATIVEDYSEFFKHFYQDVEWDPNVYQNQVECTETIYVTYGQEFWNQVNNVIFEAQAFKVYEQQKDFLLIQILKLNDVDYYNQGCYN